MSDLSLSLAETVGAIRMLSRSVASEILTIGRHLRNARTALGPDFPKWVTEQFSWSMGDVRRFIRVAIAFAAVPRPTLDRVDPTALYLLAERHAPPSARAAALEAAESGQRVTAVAARSLVAAARGTVRPTGKARRQEASDRHAADDDPAAPLAWEAILKLTEAGVLRVGRMTDAEEGDDTARPWVVHVYPEAGDPPLPVASKDSLASALTLAAGIQPVRVCKECGNPYPVFDGYSRKHGNPLGRSLNCRHCETRRVGDAKKVRRGTATVVDTPDRPAGRPPAASEGKGSPAAPPAERRTPRDG